MNPVVISTYAGIITDGRQHRNFELSARSKNDVRRQLMKRYPGWRITFREKHSSVYSGVMGKPRIQKLKK
jgi:hypothetical protein